MARGPRPLAPPGAHLAPPRERPRPRPEPHSGPAARGEADRRSGAEWRDALRAALPAAAWATARAAATSSGSTPTSRTRSAAKRCSVSAARPLPRVEQTRGAVGRRGPVRPGGPCGAGPDLQRARRGPCFREGGSATSLCPGVLGPGPRGSPRPGRNLPSRLGLRPGVQDSRTSGRIRAPGERASAAVSPWGAASRSWGGDRAGQGSVPGDRPCAGCAVLPAKVEPAELGGPGVRADAWKEASAQRGIRLKRKRSCPKMPFVFSNVYFIA